MSDLHGLRSHEEWPNGKGIMQPTKKFTHQCRFRLESGAHCNQFLSVGRRSGGAGKLAFRADQATQHYQDAHEEIKASPKTNTLALDRFFGREGPAAGGCGSTAEQVCVINVT